LQNDHKQLGLANTNNQNSIDDYQLHDLQVGNLQIYQSERFFRFGTDAVALANFANIKRSDIVVDIGTGSGVIPILAVGKFGAKYAYGIEIQKELVLWLVLA